MYRKHFFAFEGQNYWVLMLFLEAPAAKMAKKEASERAPEKGVLRVYFWSKIGRIYLKSVIFLGKGEDSCPKRVKVDQK